MGNQPTRQIYEMETTRQIFSDNCNPLDAPPPSPKGWHPRLGEILHLPLQTDPCSHGDQI